jgi:formylglycine-generating enzyme required for sulfatase activity
MRGRIGTLLLLAVALTVPAACGHSASLPDRADAQERAFLIALEALEREPANQRAQATLDTAATRLIELGTDLTVATEVSLLRWLESRERWDDLILVLNHSSVDIPAGSTTMGSAIGPANEMPQRLVELDAFAIDRYEVTNLQYAAYLSVSDAPTPEHWQDGTYPQGTAVHPVVGVSWSDAQAYCAHVGKRLPTEAEWERTCRGPEGDTYPWGEGWQSDRAVVAQFELDDPDDAWAWLASGTGPASPAPVGDPPAGVSSEGVCNLAGNAAEWMADWYDPEAYATLPDENPLGEGPPWQHSVRGGSWLFRHAQTDLVEEYSRCAARSASHSDDDPRIGFRCAGAVGATAAPLRP